MNRTRSRLLRFLIGHGPTSCADAAIALDLSRSTVRRQITLLCDAGFVTSEAGKFTTQPDQIKQQLRQLSVSFQCPVTDFREPSH